MPPCYQICYRGEVHVLIHSVDMGMIVGDAFKELLNCSIDMKAYMDSRALFHVVTRNSTTAGRRLPVNIFALRESQENEELKRFGWIKGIENPADVLTKEWLSERSVMWTSMTGSNLNVDPVC